MIITQAGVWNNFYDAKYMTDLRAKAVERYKADGTQPFVLLCEHASAYMPPELADLGLDATARKSHIAWDPGAFDVAKRLSDLLNAPLVAGGISRLVYDCNRPFEAPDCIPEKSEIYDIHGNVGLTETARRDRFAQIHEPFHAAVTQAVDIQLDRVGGPVVLVTIHSFTPIYHGKQRELDIGYLFHSDGILAQTMLAQDQALGRYLTELNAPYAASDGVTYSLAKHAEPRGLQSVMIEIRNDLIGTPEQADVMADHLAGILRHVTQVDQRKAAS